MSNKRLEEVAINIARQMAGDPSSSMAGAIYEYLSDLPCDCELGASEKRVLAKLETAKHHATEVREYLRACLRSNGLLTDAAWESLADYEQELGATLREVERHIKVLRKLVDLGE